MKIEEIKIYLDSNIAKIKNDLKDINSFESLKQYRSKIKKDEKISEVKLIFKDKNFDPIVKKEIGLLLSNYLLEIKEITNSKQKELEILFFENQNDSLGDKKNILLEEETIQLSKYLKNETEFSTLHPLTRLEFKFKEFFEKINYTFVYGNEVETIKNNFDILNIPKSHTSRSMHDTFYLTNNLLLRTHSTNVTAAKLAQSDTMENFFYSIGTVFRNDDNDATHSFQFNQVDLFATGKTLKISDLFKLINELLNFVFEKELETRYRVSYFPFTEPSFEVDIKFPNTQNWIEVLGCGMINNKVFLNTNFDPKQIIGFAAGIGLERIAMLKWSISDIREFFNNDIEVMKGIK